ncbi:MAG: HDOD domain-containing protein [Verrucomicrobia bacterium]|nr:HDOD domain-containing protein [Verrucomicrobiota bacterium]
MQELDDYINKVKSLPPAPRILPELLSLLRKDDIDADRVVKLIAFDPGITAAVLRLCNSAYFAGASPASDLQEAVTRLGFRQVYQLVAAVSGSKMLGPAQKGYGIDAGELWEHSVVSAVASQLIARNCGEDESLAFTATLLHDIGKIVLVEALEHIYTDLVENSQSEQTPLIETEKRLLGVQHAEIGGRLLARWNFPENIVNAVWFHHQPSGAQAHQRLASFVYLGNMVAYFMGYGFGHHAFALRGRTEALDILNLKPECLPEYMIKTFEQLQMVKSLVNVNS